MTNDALPDAGSAATRYILGQGCGTGGTPIFYLPGVRSLARATLYLTAKSSLGDCFGAA